MSNGATSTTGVPALLLINAGGETYIVRGGIKAAKEAGVDVTKIPSQRMISAADLKKQEDDIRQAAGLPPRVYGTSTSTPGPQNEGPMLLQAFNVLLQPPSGSSVTAVLANAHTVDLA